MSTDITTHSSESIPIYPEKQDRSEIDVQIATAHKYPRNIALFRQNALAMATSDCETAESCFYKLPRTVMINGEKVTKYIEGPGIRLAEIVGSTWGNLRYGARIIGEDKKFIIAQGIAHDLETNVAVTIEIKRRITNTYGHRYSDDLVAITANAACSIALRNAIFKVVPKTFVDAIYEAAKKLAVGDMSTLSVRRQKAVEYFRDKLGVSMEKILSYIHRSKIDEIDLNDLEALTGLKTAIKTGEISIDTAFAEPAESKKSIAESIKEKIGIMEG